MYQNLASIAETQKLIIKIKVSLQRFYKKFHNKLYEGLSHEHKHGQGIQTRS